MALPFVGKLLEMIVDKGGDIIKELVPDKDLAKRLEHSLKSQLSKENQDFRMFLEKAESDMFVAQQATIQAELHQSDLYTKRTRPKIARQSWYVTMGYALGTGLSNAFPEAWGIGEVTFSWQIFAVLSSPALTYMGVRGLEKMKNGSGT